MWGSACLCYLEDAGQLQDQSMDSKHPKKSFCLSGLGHPLEKGLDTPVLCLGHWNAKAWPLLPIYLNVELLFSLPVDITLQWLIQHSKSRRS